ncbi:MAG TPA: bifunctional helix-turn-helix transcriptional regulator/GNAT family N-acetyltransferase [Pyrinomonadaceae bacterium]|jgi:DNA-binding MarR family transcriptional regulator/N-acetylglutamate synthase-like GNAT family acetyltransferase|nr:bifunctional helix-turn-helix transcriptional regulator/GNAT family N-acetyltransferase [Pyrinomonadaceae bacterium]
MKRSQQIEAVRQFNRFYTRRIGVLRDGLLDSPFSLTEVRVLHDLSQRDQLTAGEIGSDLGLDRGYLSRILQRFEQRGLIRKTRSQTDARQSLLELTPKGRKVFAPLDTRAQKEVQTMLTALSVGQRRSLIDAMRNIEQLLNPKPEPKVPYLLRSHHPGDLGWIVHRHGALYSQEYGWDEEFEAQVAQIVSDFIENFDPKREHCWIAERDGEIVGSVMVVQKSKTVAQLRLLLVEPQARGLGIGKRLVDECIRFARQHNYRKLVLWTNSVLDAARHIYENAGFRLVHEDPHHSYGKDLVSQDWELTL